MVPVIKGTCAEIFNLIENLPEKFIEESSLTFKNEETRFDLNENNWNHMCDDKMEIVDKSFETMINETYETMIKSKAPAIKPLAPFYHTCHPPLARSSPKVTKLKIIKPKPDPTIYHYHYPARPNIVWLNNHHQTKNPVPSSSGIVRLQDQPPHSAPLAPRSYTWRGLDGGLRLLPPSKSTQVKVAEKLKATRKLLPKPSPGINQATSTTQTAVQFSLQILCPEERISPSCWVTREDTVKMKKNEVERRRRLEMAAYREKLRKMLPRTRNIKKAGSVVILQAAQDFSLKLQSQLNCLEMIKKREKSRKQILAWRLSNLKNKL